MKQQLFFCGLKSEADLLRNLSVNHEAAIIVANNPTAISAAASAHRKAPRWNLIVSFGIAGGLEPAFTPGDLIAPRNVTSATGETWSADERYLDQIREYQAVHKNLRAQFVNSVLGSDEVIATHAEKQNIFRSYAVAAVDTESHIAAKLAADLSVPLVVLRSICDTASDSLPESILNIVDLEGRPDILKIIRRLMARPGDIGPVARTALKSRTAHQTLRNCLPLFSSLRHV